MSEEKYHIYIVYKDKDDGLYTEVHDSEKKVCGLHSNLVLDLKENGCEILRVDVHNELKGYAHCPTCIVTQREGIDIYKQRFKMPSENQ